MKIEKKTVLTGAETSDNSPTLCRGDYKASRGSEAKPELGGARSLSDPLQDSRGLPVGATYKATLPREARLPINRCNLPAVVLGGLTFQQHPTELLLDGVAELHRNLFQRLEAAAPEARPEVFRDYMTVHFQLEWPEEMGFTGHRKSRAKANYIKMIRGWSFDSDSREGAVLKGWVESRFGLMPRYHGQPLRDPAGDAYWRYLEMRSQGLYGTSAHRGAARSGLYLLPVRTGAAIRARGMSRSTAASIACPTMKCWQKRSGGHHILLLNNLNSFTCSRERAGEFGDYILAVDIPLTKIFFHCGLLPGVLQGEDEFLVVGGVVDVTLSTM
jgi:NAD+--dinitrogen-reductase ADP-D-ribosyltransferase